MDDPSNRATAPWGRSSKEKNAVQKAVNALLDELAPEKVLRRIEPVIGGIEEHRTPSGCVLQAGSAALSVSWFAPGGSDTASGELHLVVWSGRVSRRGVPQPRDRATIVTELVLHPIDKASDERVWRGADGTQFDTSSLVAYCLALLDAQIKAGPQS